MSTNKPLQGLKVVDFSDTLTGAQASQLFADFGAEVIHVEKPGGSSIRQLPSYPFVARGKRSVELNLKDHSARDAARQLAINADVLIECFRPGVMEKFELGYEQLRDLNPGLVYGSITAFGRRGKYANVKGYESLVYAKLGANWVQEIIAPRPGPAHLSAPFAAYSATQTLLQGLLAALHERMRSGRGQRVDTSLAQGLSALDPWDWYLKVVTDKWPDAFTPSDVLDADGIPQSPLFFMLLQGLTKDGRWLQFSQVQPHLFLALMKALKLTWMFEDPKWKGLPVLPTQALRNEFWEIMFTAANSMTLAEWQELMDADHDLWGEIFRTGTELLDHPQMLHNKSVIEIDDEQFGKVKQVGTLVLIPESQPQLTLGAPKLGSSSPIFETEKTNLVTGSTGPDRLSLDGVTVLELGTFYAAPYGTTMLADLGARVIKIEQLDGEPMRTIQPFPEVGAAKALQGKECIAVDLATDEGREIVHKLVAQADIVLQSFRAGVAERQGVDAKTLRAINPNLVYLNSPGYGVDGPCGDRPAYAPTIGAGSGIARRNAGSAAKEEPNLSLAEMKKSAVILYNAGTAGYAQADGISAATAGTALLLGLLIRDLTGEARTMMTSMLNSAGHMLCDDVVDYANRPATLTPDQQLFGYSALHRLYECADEWVYLAAPAANEWDSLTTVFTSLRHDERFASPELRSKNDSALAQVLADLFKLDSADIHEARLLAADVGAIKVDRRRPVEVYMAEDFGGQAGWLAQIDHPTFGDCVRLTPHVELSRSGGVAKPGQLLGQSTDAVLTELGYGTNELAALREKGVII